MMDVISIDIGTDDAGTPISWHVLTSAGALRFDHAPTDDEIIDALGRPLPRPLEPSTGTGRTRAEIRPILAERFAAMAGIEAAKAYALRTNKGAAVQNAIDEVEADIFAWLQSGVTKYLDATP